MCLAVVCLLGACRDASHPLAPPDGPIAACRVDTCEHDGSEEQVLQAPLAEAARVAARSISSPSLHARLADRFDAVDRAMRRHASDDSRVALLLLLAELDAATRDRAFTADWPDLTAIQLNLEPLITQLGLR